MSLIDRRGWNDITHILRARTRVEYSMQQKVQVTGCRAEEMFASPCVAAKTKYTYAQERNRLKPHRLSQWV